MASKGTFKRGWRNALTGAALVSLLGLACWALPAGRVLVNLSYDLPFYFRSDMAVDGAVTLYMDVASEEKLSQPANPAWDRKVHARLLDRLKTFHPSAVVFDLLLESTNDPAANQELVKAAKAFGKVVMAAKPHDEVYQGEVVELNLQMPFPELREAVPYGVTEAADADKFIRRHYHLQVFDMPSMAWRAAQLTMTNPPAGPFQPRWLNYYGPPGTIPHFSYYEVFETNHIPATALSNRVVFVGAFRDVGFTGGRESDVHSTPYTRWTGRRGPGVEINATAYLNLLRGDWLSRLSKLQEAVLLVLAGAALSLGFMPFRPLTAVGLGAVVALAVAAGSIWVVWQTHFWVPWMVTVAVQIPCAVGWSALAHTTRLAMENRSLEQALAIVSKGEWRPEPSSQAEPPAPVSPQPAPEALWGRIASSARSPGLADPGATGRATVVQASPPTIPDHEMLNCFGKGAYGEVWLARDIIGSFHAVKVVYRDRFEDARPLEREFKGIKRFTPISRSHLGFVNVLQVGRNESAGYIYYVMELGDDLVSGQKIDPKNYTPKTLASELQRRNRLPLPECLEVAIHLADTLEFLHQQQLIHRDIKPSNIIFVNGLAKFADIGLVTDIATSDSDVSYLGTPGRIPPEGPGTPASDVYALGKVLYEMGFGLGLMRFPELPTDLIQSADGAELFELNRIVMRACEPDVRKRSQTAAELRSQLLLLQKSLGTAPKQ